MVQIIRYMQLEMHNNAELKLSKEGYILWPASENFLPSLQKIFPVFKLISLKNLKRSGLNVMPSCFTFQRYLAK